ncbi:MAG: transglutaminase-like domain-containing protein [Sulfurovum sp.]|nr:transglutaminase-like domain-containing protein [Sulfurovum sp.]
MLKILMKCCAAVVLCGMGILQAEEAATRTFQVTYTFDLHSDEKRFDARLWNPIPYNSSYQQVRSLSFEGNYDRFVLTRDNAYDADTFFAAWHASESPKQVRMQMTVRTTTRTVPLATIVAASKKNLPIPEAVKRYIEPSAHIPTDGIIKALAKRITRGKEDRFEKVKAIYYWCISHTFRDSRVKGCGAGDVHKMVSQKEVEEAYQNGWYGGKCTDLSSLFVALVRASGTPAREVFGIRLGKSRFSTALGKSDANGFADISTWQHCRAEYYIPAAGWIPTDPADITKLELVEKLAPDAPKVKELAKRYLHSWEMNWIGFNHARDFVLSPKPAQYPLNMFGYPYAEVAEDEVLDYYDPKHFSYKITSQEITQK